MLKRTSQDFRKIFLLEFTRQIIRNTKTEAIFELRERLKYQQELEREKIKKKERKLTKSENLQRIFKEPLKKIRKPLLNPRHSLKSAVLRIPEPRLPFHLQYLKPYATNIEIDFGKLNPLLKDLKVREIECQGENTNIIVRGEMGMKRTSIILTEEEINQIIDIVSTTSKIPKEEGLFRAVIGKINFSAIISENGSKFIMRKIINQRLY